MPGVAGALLQLGALEAAGGHVGLVEVDLEHVLRGPGEVFNDAGLVGHGGGFQAADNKEKKKMDHNSAVEMHPEAEIYELQS